MRSSSSIWLRLADKSCLLDAFLATVLSLPFALWGGILGAAMSGTCVPHHPAVAFPQFGYGFDFATVALDFDGKIITLQLACQGNILLKAS